MSSAPIKSPWEITTRATPGVMDANDLILFAPQPGTPFVTQCQSTTAAGIVAAGGGGELKAARATIPHAQILTLPTLPVVILPAPAAGLGNVVFMISMWLNPFLGNYTNVDPAAKAIMTYQPSPMGFGANIPSDILTGGIAPTLGTLESSSPAINLVQSINAGSPSALSLFFSNAAAGDFTGGNAGNILQVHMWYAVLTI